MKKTATVIFALVMMFVFSISPTIYSQILFSDDFESGQASEQWERYFSPVEPDYNLEELVEAMDMASVPIQLAEGGNYVGYLQDADGSYTGAALSIAGESTWQNYSIEGYVYCYVNQPTSAYTGLAVYCDSTIGTYIKLVADFDGDQRLRLYNNRLDPVTFQYSFTHTFTASDVPGGIPTSDGWHYMKVEVKTLNADTTAYWCYFDDAMLAGCPIYDTSDDRMSSGKAGLYSFQMDVDGVAGYYDNIVVTSLVTGVEDNPVNKINDFVLEQNYPNPFNPETKINYQLAAGSFVTLGIYDLLGREIKLLVNEEQPYGRYTVNWNGTDNFGNKVPSGIYMYTLRTGNSVFTKKMVLMK
jgi:hypothetical protein